MKAHATLGQKGNSQLASSSESLRPEPPAQEARRWSIMANWLAQIGGSQEEHRLQAKARGERDGELARSMGCKVGCIARSGGKHFDSPGLFPARYGLAISGTRFED